MNKVSTIDTEEIKFTNVLIKKSLFLDTNKQLEGSRTNLINLEQDYNIEVSEKKKEIMLQLFLIVFLCESNYDCDKY